MGVSWVIGVPPNHHPFRTMGLSMKSTIQRAWGIPMTMEIPMSNKTTILNIILESHVYTWVLGKSSPHCQDSLTGFLAAVKVRSQRYLQALTGTGTDCGGCRHRGWEVRSDGKIWQDTLAFQTWKTIEKKAKEMIYKCGLVEGDVHDLDDEMNYHWSSWHPFHNHPKWPENRSWL